MTSLLQHVKAEKKKSDKQQCWPTSDLEGAVSICLFIYHLPYQYFSFIAWKRHFSGADRHKHTQTDWQAPWKTVSVHGRIKHRRPIQNLGSSLSFSSYMADPTSAQKHESTSMSGREGDHPALIAASRQQAKLVFKHDFWNPDPGAMYKFYFSKVPSGCKSFPLFYVQHATGLQILYCLYKVQPFLTLCAISKLRAHENLDTPEHMTNCKAHGRNSHSYLILYLDAGWHFLSNKEERHLWLQSLPFFQMFNTKFPLQQEGSNQRGGRPASHDPIWAMLIGQQSALQKVCQT